ncbi:hypothetical protein HYC85_014608 [Camellia sinensis]|uniref:Uncharacterized protein n=1 Tax=Camellia sinensis TaxID=4442 RepID=A0A7J7H8P0_CAMSI|nr:hypothetical protein HYC85_014608 [Camellia sinensis]
MAQEEHTQRCSNSSSGGGCGGGGGGGGSGGSNGGGSSCRSSKKLKQKKVPQRGLGVAQLEKIRLEEQQKKDATIQAVQCATNFRHNPSPSLIPLPPPSPSDLASPNSIFRPNSSIPSIDVLHPNSVPFSKPSSNGSGGEMMGWPTIPGPAEGNWPKLWNGDCNLEGENHHGFAFMSNLNLPYESNPICPPQNVMQRTQQFQQQPSSSMVNVSSETSSLSVMSYHQMEPPSNQSFYGNNYIPPMWPEEEKMVGMKRPYPFSLDNPPGPSFPCKFPATYFPPITRFDDQYVSCVNGSTVNVEPINPIFRECPWSSTVLAELNPKKVSKENGDLNGDFLTLAPPTTALLPHPSSKYKHPSVYLTQHVQELPEFETLTFQGCVRNPIHRPGPSGSTQQQPPFYSFFPSAKAQISQATTTVGSCSGEVGENVDLNLKL